MQEDISNLRAVSLSSSLCSPEYPTHLESRFFLSPFFTVPEEQTAQNILLMLNNSFARSHLLYRILTWGSTNSIVLHPLQVLQNIIVRIIFNVKTNERITNNSLYKQLKILKIKDMYHLEVSKFMHQHQHNN